MSVLEIRKANCIYEKKIPLTLASLHLLHFRLEVCFGDISNNAERGVWSGSIMFAYRIFCAKYNKSGNIHQKVF